MDRLRTFSRFLAANGSPCRHAMPVTEVVPALVSSLSHIQHEGYPVHAPSCGMTLWTPARDGAEGDGVEPHGVQTGRLVRAPGVELTQGPRVVATGERSVHLAEHGTSP